MLTWPKFPLLSKLVTARSGRPSPLRSPTATEMARVDETVTLGGDRRIADRQTHGGLEGAGAGGVLQQVGHLAGVVGDDEIRQAIAIEVGDLHIIGLLPPHGDGGGGAIGARGGRGLHEHRERAGGDIRHHQVMGARCRSGPRQPGPMAARRWS